MAIKLSGNAKNLTNQKFGRLVVLEPVARTVHQKIVWSCRCDCGNKLEVIGSSLLSGNTKSCGCLMLEIAHEINRKPENRYELIDGGKSARITLERLNGDTAGYVLVDAVDLEIVLPYRWALKQVSENYAIAVTAVPLPSRHMLRMHQLLMQNELQTGLEVDHRNGNPLDNRRENLRVATHQQNQQNQTKVLARSGYKGVHQAHSRTGWTAKIKVDGVSQYLGTFKTSEDAAIAYNKAAQVCFGEFACLNVIPENEGRAN